MAELPELPEPAREAESAGAAWRNSSPDYYTADQMREYARAAIQAERERCAKVCDQISAQLKAQVPKRGASTSPTYGGVVGAAKCAAAIRGQAEGRE